MCIYVHIHKYWYTNTTSLIVHKYTYLYTNITSLIIFFESILRNRFMAIAQKA